MNLAIPKTVPPLSKYIKPYEDINQLLKQLAKYCIKYNLYRQDNNFYDFSDNDIKAMNKAWTSKTASHLDGGYFFLDDPNSNDGMIRLYYDGGNPKWSFWVENGKIKVDWA